VSILLEPIFSRGDLTFPPKVFYDKKQKMRNLSVLNRIPLSCLWCVGILSGLLFLATLVTVPIFIALIPPDYFTRERPRPKKMQPTLFWILLILKNLLGLILIISGIAMLILPGQGVITILVGLSLLDFPGKKRIERRLIEDPRVFKTMNWIRARAHKPPLEYPTPSHDQQYNPRG